MCSTSVFLDVGKCEQMGYLSVCTLSLSLAILVHEQMNEFKPRLTEFIRIFVFKKYYLRPIIVDMCLFTYYLLLSLMFPIIWVAFCFIFFNTCRLHWIIPVISLFLMLILSQERRTFCIWQIKMVNSLRYCW